MTAAPGGPGLPPTWCSSDKEIVGCALGSSRLWFTIGGGIINEVYYPRIDIPQIRDLGFIVADGAGFWVEVKRMWRHVMELAAPGVPAARIVHRHERFELTLRVAPCEHRDVLLIEVSLRGDATLKPYALLAPHLGATGNDNQAAVCAYRGRRVLWAAQGPFALALAAADAQQRDAWGRASAGFVGNSDGWQDFARHGGAQLGIRQRRARQRGADRRVAAPGGAGARLRQQRGIRRDAGAHRAVGAVRSDMGAAAAGVDALARRRAPSKKSWSPGCRASAPRRCASRRWCCARTRTRPIRVRWSPR